jgi:hypothetical protein
VGESPTPDDVVLEDDFSEASIGWLGGEETTFVGENTDQEIAAGVFRITVKTAEGRGGPDSMDLLVDNASELESLDDVAIEVDATVVQPADDAFYALMCRLQDFDNFYGFAIVEGGSVSIFEIRRGFTSELTSASADVDLAATHRVRAECVGERLALVVDGAEVAQVTDTTFDTGAVGFLAETRGEPGFTVEFDDLAVREPKPAG